MSWNREVSTASIDIPDRERNRFRHTACLHRTPGIIHDFGFEYWLTLRGSQRIRNAVPSTLMITSFGYRKDDSGSRESRSSAVLEPDSAHVPVRSRGTLS